MNRILRVQGEVETLEHEEKVSIMLGHSFRFSLTQSPVAISILGSSSYHRLQQESYLLLYSISRSLGSVLCPKVFDLDAREKEAAKSNSGGGGGGGADSDTALRARG